MVGTSSLSLPPAPLFYWKMYWSLGTRRTAPLILSSKPSSCSRLVECLSIYFAARFRNSPAKLGALLIPSLRSRDLSIILYRWTKHGEIDISEPIVCCPSPEKYFEEILRIFRWRIFFDIARNRRNIGRDQTILSLLIAAHGAYHNRTVKAIMETSETCLQNDSPKNFHFKFLVKLWAIRKSWLVLVRQKVEQIYAAYGTLF